ncbi:MAG: RNA polymerase sigma-54 factor [Candidatus Omnitrophota bacterium]|jgi:RNA polymerase sigma-54 factor|nr:MAG: RNA polymerase sigma-54 factor [Candidatus Omnitrophota bacterium]
MMQTKQRTELRRLLVPALSNSLNVLALPLSEIEGLIEKELESNPALEEKPSYSASGGSLAKGFRPASPLSLKKFTDEDVKFQLESVTKKTSLQDCLLRQLGIFVSDDGDFRIGEEIIGNIDENGYLKASFDEIASSCAVPAGTVERILKIIHEFEPAGVGARSVKECLLIQLDQNSDTNPILREIVEKHLDNVAKKNFKVIAKDLNQDPGLIEELAHKILRLDPKPGRNYSTEEDQRIRPDARIEIHSDDIEVIINDESLPKIDINKEYKAMLKDKSLDPNLRKFITEKIKAANDILRAISKRKSTLKLILEVIADIQCEAIKNEEFSLLKPLTFKEVAQRINMHETTVCRAIMNKYVKTPWSMVAIKDFFPSKVFDTNGQSVSCNQAKKLIKDCIDIEDKSHPLSDKQIAELIHKNSNIKVSRRTVTKYRQDLKILSTVFRRKR